MQNLNKTVFRLSGLPNTTENTDDVVELLSSVLGQSFANSVRVFSLASTLYYHGISLSKVATLMLTTLPPFINDNPDLQAWPLPKHPDVSGDLILDRHFLGLTPLNDVDRTSYLYDCIAISGLGSHPFGSWQPRNDKTFMWIRDHLTKHRPDTRAIIYGYDTKLKDSQSFQSIKDLALELCNHLVTCGWYRKSSKPVAFLAHSLGGLVLKQALVQLYTSKSPEWNTIAKLLKGAIFFGVPNFGMEQAHLMAIVKDNPNETLVDAIAHDSDFLIRLEEAFKKSVCNSRFQCIWAYEKVTSPTVIQTADGRFDRNGPRAILVGPDSATRRFVRDDPSIVIGIDETHSDMVKFTNSAPYLQHIIARLFKILPPYSEMESTTRDLPETDLGTNRMFTSAITTAKHEVELGVEIEIFKRGTALTAEEEVDIRKATFDTAQVFLNGLQREQSENAELINLIRLEKFLVSLQQLEEVLSSCKTSPSPLEAMSFIWGSLILIIATANKSPSTLHSILDAYKDIGSELLLYNAFISTFESRPHLREVLVMTYRDILEFQQHIIQHFKPKKWQRLFAASWIGTHDKINHIKENIARNRRLIESKVSLAEFEQVKSSRISAMKTYQWDSRSEDEVRRKRINLWLSSYDIQQEHGRLREARSACKQSGGWLIRDRKFQQWFDPQNDATPCLWLCGKPGAGKTVLASIIVDEAKKAKTSGVIFFYCKHKQQDRNSFIGVARSFLMQMFEQQPCLIHQLWEKVAVDVKSVLMSKTVAEELLKISFSCFERLYIILDGLDECETQDRKDIADWFQKALEDLKATENCFARCLFVSQKDGMASKTLGSMPVIDIQERNQIDIKEYANVWDEKITGTFGSLEQDGFDISQVIAAKSNGMFIFAKLYAQYLASQVLRQDLLAELNSNDQPLMLNDVYDRIYDRVTESRSGRAMKRVQQILGWIICAKRPLKWREIQGAVCIDIENQCLNFDHQIPDSPQGLFASLVEVHADGTVQLVHETARSYLLSKDTFNARKVDCSLSQLSLDYLLLPAMSAMQSENDIKSYLIKGTYAFYDYASACWFMHLESGIPGSSKKTHFVELKESLETFIDVHWSEKHKPLSDVKRAQKLLAPLQTSRCYRQIVQAVSWAKKQSSHQGQGPSADDALKIHELTEAIRSVLENMNHSSLLKEELQKILHVYGRNRFKCPRINCYRYYEGFPTAAERVQHMQKHERPFLCFVRGCHFGFFGFATENKLKKHLFEFHGIIRYDETEKLAFPKESMATTIRKSVPSAKNSSTHECKLCGIRFTRGHNLKAHLRKHQDIKPFVCSICNEGFSRKTDCDRHKLCHGEKRFKCFGGLKHDGFWGCGQGFRRSDKLGDHLKTKKGKECLRPLIERLEESNSVSEDQDSIFAEDDDLDARRVALRILGTFEELSHLSILQTLSSHYTVSSPGNSTSHLTEQGVQETPGWVAHNA